MRGGGNSLTRTNAAPRDYYVFPSIDVTADRLRFAEQNGLSLDTCRFDTFDFFFSMTGRARFATGKIRVINLRVRNRRTFEENGRKIARVGLNRPITVTRRATIEPAGYDLVCDQGRLEAFIELKSGATPAIVIVPTS